MRQCKHFHNPAKSFFPRQICAALRIIAIVRILQQIAWMKHHGIQESSTLDYATLYPGYACWALGNDVAKN